MTGLHLSQYRIDAELGRGGMGIVYKATDTKLNRTVALKVLPAAALSSEDDRARFVREAQSAAQLHHPNIATVFGIDEAVPVEPGKEPQPGTETRLFIAMEYIEGETVREVVEKGPLKLQDAVNIAGQVAEALKEAHAKQIVHRDIKSANVMLTTQGVAKVLDFGLAKTNQSTMLTRMGSTLGTVAYMSPEQARGHEVDGRTDLYSLGTMLYEMVAGKLPFGGDYEQAVLYGIMNEPPEPLTAVRTGVPFELERIVAKLLSKEAEYRYQTAGDLLADLKSLSLGGSGVTRRSMPAQTGAEAAATRSAVLRMWVYGAIAGALVIGALGAWLAKPGPPLVPAPLLRVELPLRGMVVARFPTMSPTREWIAVTGNDTTGQAGVFFVETATGRVRRIPDTGLATRELYFSTDGTRLGFTEGANGGVLVASVPDGRPIRVTEQGRIVAWENTRTIIYVDDSAGGSTYRIDVDSGERELALPAADNLGEGEVDNLKTLVRGTDVAFGHRLVRMSTGFMQGEPSLVRLDMASGAAAVIESGAINPNYVDPGFLAYQTGGDSGPLMVRRIDADEGTFAGTPVDVFPDDAQISWPDYTITPVGDLLYLGAGVGSADFADSRLFRVRLDERTIEPVRLSISGFGDIGHVVYSPDGKQLAFSAVSDGDRDISDGDRDIWTMDLATGIISQVTFTDATEDQPRWSPDGRELFFARGETVYRTPLDGSGAEEPVVAGSFVALSHDGRTIAYAVAESVGGTQPLILRDRESGDEVAIDSTGRIFPVDFSPDDRYVAYAVGANLDVRLRVRSVGGPAFYDLAGGSGYKPTWTRQGDWLYFFTGEGISRVAVSTNPRFRFLGSPEPVVTAFRPLFDISPDGRELMVTAPRVDFAGSRSASHADPVLVWLQNWAAHLDRTVPR